MEFNTRIVVTGFKPFAKYLINSSWEAVKVLKEKKEDVHCKELTVDFQAAHYEITNLLLENPSDILLLTGLADQKKIRIEKNAKKPVQLENIQGPSFLTGSWPWEENIRALNSMGIPSTISLDAGSYVCESVYWSALNFRREHGYPANVAFIHVPVLSTKWSADSIADALAISLNCLIEIA
jgi:pyroglutamyl-peptidase